MKRALLIIVIVLLLIDLSVWAPILYVDHQFIKLRETLCAPNGTPPPPPKFAPMPDNNTFYITPMNMNVNGSSCSLFQYTVNNTVGGNAVTRELTFYGYNNGKPFRVYVYASGADEK